MLGILGETCVSFRGKSNTSRDVMNGTLQWTSFLLGFQCWTGVSGDTPQSIHVGYPVMDQHPIQREREGRGVGWRLLTSRFMLQKPEFSTHTVNFL